MTSGVLEPLSPVIGRRTASDRSASPGPSGVDSPSGTMGRSDPALQRGSSGALRESPRRGSALPGAENSVRRPWLYTQRKAPSRDRQAIRWRGDKSRSPGASSGKANRTPRASATATRPVEVRQAHVGAGIRPASHATRQPTRLPAQTAGVAGLDGGVICAVSMFAAAQRAGRTASGNRCSADAGTTNRVQLGSRRRAGHERLGTRLDLAHVAIAVLHRRRELPPDTALAAAHVHRCQAPRPNTSASVPRLTPGAACGAGVVCPATGRNSSRMAPWPVKSQVPGPAEMSRVQFSVFPARDTIETVPRECSVSQLSSR